MLTTTPRRVLVIEDEALVAMLIEDTLLAAGCDVEVAACGEEALLMASKNAPDLVVMDIYLPGEPRSAELLRQLRAIVGPLSAVVVTGLSLTGEERRSLELAGGGLPIPVLQKPFLPEDLVSEVVTRLTSASHVCLARTPLASLPHLLISGSSPA